MKRLLTLGVLIALLGGCAIVPLGYPYHDHEYREYRGYGYDDGYRWHDRGGGPRWGYGDYRR
jgi:hypothetical protein